MFDIIYYWLQYYLTKMGRTKDPKGDGYLVLMILELITAVGIIKCFGWADNFYLEKPSAIGLGILVIIFSFGINYLFISRRREKIINRIANYSSRRRVFTKIFFFAYLLFCLMIMGLLGDNII